MPRLFVYGTLRLGQSAAHLMVGAEFLGEATLRANLVQFGAYTGLRPGGSLVRGEMFQVPESLFGQLDKYEGPDYVRRLSEVECAGETVTAWVYWLV
jgi:gamma-glutamylcyclotransferase (GGCT)/AIG2-like uncharacterized protein YtfP